MRLDEMVKQLALEPLTPELAADEPVELTGGHASDLLSDVLANAPRGGALVTIQVHINVIAVALHAGLAAVVFAAGRAPDETVRTKAVGEGLRLYRSNDSTFDIVGRLYALGLRGSQEWREL